MKFNVTRYFTSAIGIVIACLTVSAYAGQACDLGQVCPIPGDDGGITYFRVYPNQGDKFTCDITASNEKLSFVLYSGKNYTINSITGCEKALPELPLQAYTANPTCTANINGKFDSPDPEKNGNIKFLYIKWISDGTGTVICNVAPSK